MGTAEGRTAFAPATVANVAVGFDVLGFALHGVGDRITVRRLPGSEGVVVERVTGVVQDLPRDAERNTAAVALRSLLGDLGVDGSFGVTVDKGIPLSAGMGGSAASAVGAVVAGNALLGDPAPPEALLRHALVGEAAASGAPHADNAAPCLHGGLVAVISHDPPEVVTIPVPAAVRCVLVHPALRVNTKDARSVLRPEVALADHVRQSARLAGFVAGCHRGDLDLIGKTMSDLLIEPQRSPAIPGFDEAKRGALDAGALGFGIAGSGPSVFAWVRSAEQAERVAAAVTEVFRARGLDAESWISPLDAPGAAVG